MNRKRLNYEDHAVLSINFARQITEKHLPQFIALGLTADEFHDYHNFMWSQYVANDWKKDRELKLLFDESNVWPSRRADILETRFKDLRGIWLATFVKK